LAAKLGHKPLVTILLANGAELNSQDHYVEYPNGNQGLTPLIEATRGGFIEISQQLIFKGANINKIDQLSLLGYETTALMVAAENHNLEIVKILVENGADLNIGLDNKGCATKSTALDFVDPRDAIIVEYLQERGARHKLDNRDNKNCVFDSLGAVINVVDIRR
jgi:ankyrin repeat protein